MKEVLVTALMIKFSEKRKQFYLVLSSPHGVGVQFLQTCTEEGRRKLFANGVELIEGVITEGGQPTLVATYQGNNDEGYPQFQVARIATAADKTKLKATAKATA